MRKTALILAFTLIVGCFAGCSASNMGSDTGSFAEPSTTPNDSLDTQNGEISAAEQGETAMKNSIFTDKNGDIAVIPDRFRVSEKEDEQTVSAGLVVIGLDGSEFVWIHTTKTPLAVRDFGSYVSWGSSFEDYYDETELESYRDMITSVQKYGGFYMGRFEASLGGGYNLMGGACSGSSYPSALRDPLPGSGRHPNVTFRIALYLK